jgi:hypothetical protein
MNSNHRKSGERGEQILMERLEFVPLMEQMEHRPPSDTPRDKGLRFNAEAPLYRRRYLKL